ncbi:hypothetical protein LINPERPRIM_LOCUS25432 [Linum perenne]
MIRFVICARYIIQDTFKRNKSITRKTFPTTRLPVLVRPSVQNQSTYMFRMHKNGTITIEDWAEI